MATMKHDHRQELMTFCISYSIIGLTYIKSPHKCVFSALASGRPRGFLLGNLLEGGREEGGLLEARVTSAEPDVK